MKENKTDIVFVVLHYMAKEVTKKCVEKIKEKIDVNSYKIVIVDNASANGSGQELMEYYATDDFVKVLLNNKNLGFAKGNNVGFQYATKYLSPRFIVLMNNDVFLIEDKLMYKIEREYEKSQFAVLGPLIMTRDGKCNINPIENAFDNKDQIKKKIKSLKRTQFLRKYHLLLLYSMVIKIVLLIKGNKQKQNRTCYKNYLESKYNVQLHGCFLVFSQKYMEYFNGLDDRTFLYMEEDILYKHMKENRLVTAYIPDIIVYHEEDVSTDSVVRTEKEKKQFLYKCLIESCNDLLKVYEEYEKKD